MPRKRTHTRAYGRRVHGRVTHTHIRASLAACRSTEGGGWVWYWPVGRATSTQITEYRRAKAKYKLSSNTNKNLTTPFKRPPASRGFQTPTKRQRTAAAALVKAMTDVDAKTTNASEKSGERGVGVELTSESDDGGDDAQAASLKCDETLSAAK